jgi:oligoribonuclease
MTDRDRLVFADLETLGLKNDSPIVEIAMVICTPNLEVLAQRTQVVRQDQEAWAACPAVVQAMHRSSGLMAESLELDRMWRLEQGVGGVTMTAVRRDDSVTRTGTSLAEVEEAFIVWLMKHGFGHHDAVIAGNSIGQDRIWIATQMPALNEFLNYRMVDVSAVRQLIQLWAFSDYSGPKGDAAHRALPDCLWSHRELALYRRALFTGREDDIAGWLGAPLRGPTP